MNIHHGDCRTILPTLPANSVQCVVTSPPYFGLRDYGVDGQIGLETVPDCLAWARGEDACGLCYVCAMRGVFGLVWRVLRDDGVLWLNLGDSYGRGKRVLWQGDAQRGTNAHKVVTDAGGYGASGAILPDKNLLGIPWRVALALQADGWILRSDIIWSKPNAMPESVKDRPTRAHEYLFLFSKQQRYFYDADAIKEPAVDGDPRPPRGSQETLSGGQLKINSGRRDKQGESGLRRYEGFNERWDERTEPLTHRNARSVWSIATTPYADAHFATFPEALAERCIKAGSRPGDLVLDPFGGSGTVARVAERLGRSWALIELNQDYIELQERRTNGVQKELLV